MTIDTNTRNRMNNLTTTVKKILMGIWILLLFALGFLSWRAYSARSLPDNNSTSEVGESDPQPVLPPTILPLDGSGISRLVVLKTNKPSDRPNTKVIQYTVEKGDSIWLISQKYNLKPESILWANENLGVLVNRLKVGEMINIPPMDGVLHAVQEGDTLESISQEHGIPVNEIVGFMGNEFDLANPSLRMAQLVMIPNGTSPIILDDPEPVVAAGGVTSGGYSGPLVNIGTGYFSWPIGGAIILNQEYWGGHPALDINTYFRQPVFASDSGTVVFSGWSDTGYGYLVIIDHGNGYRTYYAHNEALLVSVGQGVFQGQQIAESGSTGNSTGNHLDFRIRATGGGFYNPLDYLP